MDGEHLIICVAIWTSYKRGCPLTCDDLLAICIASRNRLRSRGNFLASRVDFGAISDPSGRPWKPKNIVKYDVFAAFHVAPQRTSRSSKSALGGSQNDPQEAPRSGPARPRRPPRRFQERHKRPKSAPRAAQPRLLSGLGGQVGPN